MVKIRMARRGATKKPFYRIVVTDSENPRDGRFIEILGTYDPRAKTNGVILKSDRVQHWLKQGAQASQTVAQLIKKYQKYQAA